MLRAVNQQLKQIFIEAGAEISCDVMLNKSKPEHGDGYQINGAIRLAKILNQSPKQLADKIADSIKVNLSSINANSIRVSENGFINFEFDVQYLINNLNQTSISLASRIVLDYSSPNIAKEMHVGHLRSTIIGDALGRVLEYLGHTVIRQNHLGDFGTPIAMIASFVEDKTSYDLNDAYVAAKAQYQTSANFKQLVDSRVKSLQTGEYPELLKCVEEFTKKSIAHCSQMYQLLNIKLTESDIRSESSYMQFIPDIIKTLQQNAADIVRYSQGALCAFINQDPVIIQKSDGAYLYSTTDLAAIWYRANVLKADKVIYVVDKRQQLHFETIFALSHQAKLSNNIPLIHVAFGTIMNQDGKPFKTREGNTIKLLSLIEQAIEKAKNIIHLKHPEWSTTTIDSLAKIIAIGSIKYNDLSKLRTIDYKFNLEHMLSFEGNTAPYIMYAYTRINSILNKIQPPITQEITISSHIEYSILQHLAIFMDVLYRIEGDYNPHHLCQYLYELSTLFMRFYETQQILNTDHTSSRLNICIAVANKIKLGLELLGINTVVVM